MAEDKKNFPECASTCGVVDILGVCECEAICPEKFDENGNPINVTLIALTS